MSDKRLFCASGEDFKKIPGSLIVYWVSEKMIKVFENKPMTSFGIPRQGMSTGEVNRFVRQWHEVSVNNTNLLDGERRVRWIRYNKGGDFRRWYGNRESIVRWECDGSLLKSAGAVLRNSVSYFNSFIAWSKISIKSTGFRFFEKGFLFDGAGGALFLKEENDNKELLGLLNSVVTSKILNLISPTINFNESHIGSIPIVECEGVRLKLESNVTDLISLSRSDWDEYETSWDFKSNPLVHEAMERPQSTLDRGDAAQERATNHLPLSTLWERIFSRRMECAARMKELEEENNRLFIAAYGLEDELKPDVAWRDVSLTGNPFYRYKVDAEEAGSVPPELATRACADALRELISYGIGCLMGRYSLAKEGLILASQGETMADYWREVGGADAGRPPYQTDATSASLPPDAIPPSQSNSHCLVPDDDGIMPLVSGETAFTDNAPQRIVDFIRVAFGEANLTANLNFIEATLGMTLEAYLAKEFWNDHRRTYKNRPIYWLFRSKKGAFQALVYMHRMDAYTVSKIRTAYLLPHIEFLRGRIAVESARGAELTAKERTGLKKMQLTMDECLEYEGRLHVVADRMEALDLDDGVLVNYAKFGDVLAKLK